MDRINLIWNHPLYREQFKKLVQAEEERIFCRHTLEHFLDVARLAYIYNLEEQAGVERDLIYAAALLHDIGRFRQIQDGTPHDKASAVLAGQILPDCGFLHNEISDIQTAILEHRGHADAPNDGKNSTAAKLSHYLYQADKRSRCCFVCPAEPQCNWSAEKKNLQILI